MASGSSGGKAAPFRWLRWLAALLLTGGALGIYAFWVFTGAHPACQVTVTGSAAGHLSGQASAAGRPSGQASAVRHPSGQGSAVTRTCGLPDVANFGYVLAVVAVLLLPDAQSIKFGGLEFVRLTNAVREQAAELDRLSQQVSQVVHTTSTISVTIAAARLAGVVAEGEASGQARPAADLTDEFGDPGSP